MQLIVRLIVVAKPAAGRRSSLSSFSSFSPLIAAAYRAFRAYLLLSQQLIEFFELISSYRSSLSSFSSLYHILLSQQLIELFELISSYRSSLLELFELISSYGSSLSSSYSSYHTRKGGCCDWKPSSSSIFSIRAFRAYLLLSELDKRFPFESLSPLIGSRQTAPFRAIRGNRAPSPPLKVLPGSAKPGAGRRSSTPGTSVRRAGPPGGSPMKLKRCMLY